jgi:uncharacterized protein (DUF2062 family)
MFKRRYKLKFYRRAQDFLWPRLGWKRSTEYLFHRIGRLPGTPYSIAAGFSCGAAVSFTPFVGLHIVLAGFCAWLIRANIMAGVIGTALGNPWTFPFIWTFIFNLGVRVGMVGNGAKASELDFPRIFSTSMDAILTFDLSYLFETAWPVLWPMFIGGIPAFVVVWLIFYFPLRSLIKRYQSNRRKRASHEFAISKEQENRL